MNLVYFNRYMWLHSILIYRVDMIRWGMDYHKDVNEQYLCSKSVE